MQKERGALAAARMFSINFFIVCVIAQLIAQITSWEKTLQIDHMSGKCREIPGAPITLNNIRIFKENRRFFLSMKITSRQRLEHDLLLTLKAKRCRSQDAPDTCENYQTINIRHMCDKLVAKHHTWSPFMQRMRPKLRCPIEKRVYTVENGTFDAEVLALFPLDEWYWKAEAYLFDVVENATVMCIYVEGKLSSV